MASYLSPGVFVERVSGGGAKPMTSVSTSTLVVPGYYPDGPSDRVEVVTSWPEFERKYGGDNVNSDNSNIIRSFYDNGGERVIPYRLVAPDAAKADTSSVLGWVVTALNNGVKYNGYKITVAVNVDTSTKFDLTISDGTNDIESFDSVYLDLAHVNDKDYVINRVNGVSQFVVFSVSGIPTGGVGVNIFANGLDGTAPSATELSAAFTHGSAYLDKFTTENLLIAAPDFLTNTSIGFLITYAKARNDCFVIYGGDSGSVSPSLAGTFRASVTNSQKSAMYWPNIRVYDVLRKSVREISPIGAVAGVYARTDSTRNVGKNPAGIVDGALMNVVSLSVSGVKYVPTKGDMDTLYSNRVNPLISNDSGIAVWGCRTTSVDPEWRYINHERLFQYIEKKIEKSTLWVNFENNTTDTRIKLASQVTGELLSEHNDGYFAGNTPAESFFVICDKTNNPQTVIDSGQLICDIGVAPGKPSEFVRFRLRQKTLK